jgi:hypothetical protein
VNEIAIVRSRIEPGIDRREIPEGPDEDQCGEDSELGSERLSKGVEDAP